MLEPNNATWSPDNFGIRSIQNFQLWNDIEEAYTYVEAVPPYTITGNLKGFMFELVRRRWNLACTDSYEPPPSPGQDYQYNHRFELIPEAPLGLIKSRIDKLSLNDQYVDHFIDFANQIPIVDDHDQNGKLFGYGTDGFGTYLPLHLLWPILADYWGIYISETGVLSLAASFYQHLGNTWSVRRDEEKISKLIDSLIQIAYQVVLRHQLFHYKIEQWCLLHELITGQAYYLPYLQEVYLPTLLDPADTNLEEALANLSIVLSKKISKIEKEAGIKTMHLIKEYFLSQQGPGYRNFNLGRGIPFLFGSSMSKEKYRKVVNYLCNQIVQHNISPKKPLVPYYLYPPNNNFLRAEELCPIYLVKNLSYNAGIFS